MRPKPLHALTGLLLAACGGPPAPPAGVLRQPTLYLDIGVTHYKAPGAPWAQVAILVVYAAFIHPYET
jgi:hypothetical protein